MRSLRSDQPDPTNVVLAADSNYWWPALVLLNNLADLGIIEAASKPRIHLAYIDGGLRPWEKDFAQEVAKRIGLDPQFKLLSVPATLPQPKHPYLTKTAMIRLQLSNLLRFEPWFWLDTDTIVATSWSDLSNAFMPRVRLREIIAAKQWQIDSNRPLSIARPDTYFNSGVMSCHTKTDYRELYFEAFDVTGIGDQDVLNFVHSSNTLLAPQWNTYGAALFNHNLRKAAKVLHFTGRTKPWHIDPRAKEICAATENCPFQMWFQAEQRLVAKLKGEDDWKAISRRVRKSQSAARRAGKFDRKITLFSSIWPRTPRFLKVVIRPLMGGIENRGQAHPFHDH